jgi:hypothetical protein
MENQFQNKGIDFSQSEPFVCEECGNDRFTVQYLIKRFSALLSPTGNEMIVPVQAFACSKCEHINKEFLPENDDL